MFSSSWLVIAEFMFIAVIIITYSLIMIAKYKKLFYEQADRLHGKLLESDQDRHFLQYLYETDDAEIIVLDNPMVKFSSSLVQRILPESHWKAGGRYMEDILSNYPVPSPITRRELTLVVDTAIVGRDVRLYELIQKAREENGKSPAQFMTERTKSTSVTD